MFFFLLGFNFFRLHEEFLVNCMALNILKYPMRIILAGNDFFKYSGTLKQLAFLPFDWRGT